MTCVTFRNKLLFYGEELLAPPNHQAGRPPLVGCPQLPSVPGGRLLHPLSDDAPCRGDRGTHNTTQAGGNRAEHRLAAVTTVFIEDVAL